MRLHFFVIFNVVLTLCTQALAKDFAPPVKSSAMTIDQLEINRRAESYSDPIFQRTLKLCGASFTDVLKLTYSRAAEFGSFLTGDPAAIRSFANGRGLSSETQIMLHSPAFYDAIQYCLPQQPVAQVYFISSFVTADLAGKVDFAVVVFTWWKLYNWSVLAASKVFGIPLTAARIFQWTTIGLSITASATNTLMMYYDEKSKAEAAKRASATIEKLKIQGQLDRDIEGDQHAIDDPLTSPAMRAIALDDLHRRVALRRSIGLQK